MKVSFQLALVARAMTPIQLRLGIEQVHLARPAVLEKTDDGLSPGGMMRRPRRKRIGRRLAERVLLSEQVSQRHRANAACRASQECPAVHAKIEHGNTLQQNLGSPQLLRKKERGCV